MDINNFGPFRSDVWGTVEEWVVGIAGLVALLFTLRNQVKATNYQARATELQAKASQEQIKINEIAYLSFIRGAIPKIEISYENINTLNGKIAIHFMNSEVINLEIVNLSDNAFYFESRLYKWAELPAFAKIYLKFTFQESQNSIDGYFRFNISYTTYAGKRYIQEAELTFPDKGFFITPPKLIS